MRLIGATPILVLICTTSALAAELPSRKPGLWEVKTSIENRNAPAQVIRQCIDAATDQMMQSSAGPFALAVCPKREVQDPRIRSRSIPPARSAVSPRRRTRWLPAASTAPIR